MYLPRKITVCAIKWGRSHLSMHRAYIWQYHSDKLDDILNDDVFIARRLLAQSSTSAIIFDNGIVQLVQTSDGKNVTEAVVAQQKPFLAYPKDYLNLIRIVPGNI